MRLQEEILINWNRNAPFDESLFAWTAEQIESSGLLAPAPGCFQYARGIIFDPKVAAKRRGLKPQSPAINTAKQITLPVSQYIAIPPAVILLTFGIPYWVTVLPLPIYKEHRKSREVKLNCWTKGPDGNLRAVKIKMERAADKSWRRVDCGRLYESTSLKLYPSTNLAMVTANVLKITSEVRYKSS